MTSRQHKKKNRAQDIEHKMVINVFNEQSDSPLPTVVDYIGVRNTSCLRKRHYISWWVEFGSPVEEGVRNTYSSVTQLNWTVEAFRNAVDNRRRDAEFDRICAEQQSDGQNEDETANSATIVDTQDGGATVEADKVEKKVFQQKGAILYKRKVSYQKKVLLVMMMEKRK